MPPKSKAYVGTAVAAGTTQEQIEKMLRAHGVSEFHWSNYETSTEFQFCLRAEKPIDFRLFLNWEEERYKKQYFRALHFFIKSQLEAVEFGLFTFVEAFMPSIVSGDQTFGQIALAQMGGNVLPERTLTR